jgi:uncharacterized protein (TIGR02266 family)
LSAEAYPPRGAPAPQRRRYPRAPLSLQLRYGGDSASMRDGFSAVVGGGGLFIESVNPLPIGTRIEIELPLPGLPLPIKAAGRVVWVRPEFDPRGLSPGMAIAFDDLPDPARQRITEIVMRILLGRPLDDA